jgi:predicted transposase YbfD/YdcC
VASRVLALNLRRLSQDWEICHGHPVLLAETFVDSARFRGTCYRAAGWQTLGETRGFGKRNQRYWYHGQKKTVLVRPLSQDAVSRLVAPFLPALKSSGKEMAMIDVNALPVEGEGGLIDLLKTIVDPRKPRGVRHPVVTVVAIAVCAALSGARSFEAIAQWAQGLSREGLRKLGSKRWRPPSEPTVRRVLQGLDANTVDARIGQWILGQHSVARQGVAVDGKTVRGAHDAGQRAPHLLSAILHDEAVVIGQLEVEEKTNEIPKLPELLAPLPLEGAVITADAMHTQSESARSIVETKKADYLFTVKDNQPTLRQDISDLKLESFPPSTHHNRKRPRPSGGSPYIWTSAELTGYIDFPHAAQVFAIQRETTEIVTQKFRSETVYGITSLKPAVANSERVLSLSRGHWSIENRLHWVRDVTFDEDRSRVRRGTGAQVMASLRNLAVSLLRMAGADYIPCALRHCARQADCFVLRIIGVRL